jgi:hypothetical protein
MRQPDPAQTPNLVFNHSRASAELHPQTGVDFSAFARTRSHSEIRSSRVFLNCSILLVDSKTSSLTSVLLLRAA